MSKHEPRPRDQPRRDNGKGKYRRSCLRCDRKFTTDSPYIRLCAFCRGGCGYINAAQFDDL